MNTPTVWTLMVLFIVLVLGTAGAVWLFSDKVPAHQLGQGAASSTPAGVTSEKGNLLLGIDGPAGKTYLIGFNGRPLYIYDTDEGGTSFCYGGCTPAWPPYLVPDASALRNLQAGVKGKVGTITRADGGLQVTYDDKPLYFHAADTDTSGPLADSANSLWHVANPGTAQTKTVALNQATIQNGITITPLAVVEDSRCPTDVQCIQAGTVRLSVNLEGHKNNANETLTLGKPLDFEDVRITLLGVAPVKNSKTTIAPGDYRFTFSVTNTSSTGIR